MEFRLNYSEPTGNNMLHNSPRMYNLQGIERQMTVFSASYMYYATATVVLALNYKKCVSL